MLLSPLLDRGVAEPIELQTLLSSTNAGEYSVSAPYSIATSSSAVVWTWLRNNNRDNNNKQSADATRLLIVCLRTFLPLLLTWPLIRSTPLLRCPGMLPLVTYLSL